MAILKDFQADALRVRVSDSREAMGRDAARAAGERIRALLRERDEINMIFAAAPSQNETLKYLAREEGIDWHRVNAFHMDEYVGLSREAPQSFGYYLCEHVFSLLPFKSVNFLRGDAPDAAAECARYAELLRRFPPDVVMLGIGENGHIAFNDPPADFETEQPYLVIRLDEKCRRQQLGEGWFPTLADVPERAISMGVRQILKSRSIINTVPDRRKAEAVRGALEGEVSNLCPASILRTHADVTTFLDSGSASLLERKHA